MKHNDRLSALSTGCEEPQIFYEHVFNNYIEHKPNTNEYVYKYPEHWNTYKGKKEIGLRSVIVKNASRDLKLKHLFFRSNVPVNVNIGFSISLSSNDDMSAANEKFKKAIKTKYIEYKDEMDNIRLTNPTAKNNFGIDDYCIEYLHATNEFWIKVLKNDSEFPCYLYVEKANEYMSEDLKSILNVEDELFAFISMLCNNEITRSTFDEYIRAYPNVIIRFNSDNPDDTKITGIGFKKVWNRETLFISSSISTLAEDKFLTLSNVEHNPLKYYDITGYPSTFSLYLYDASKKNNVEIPNDRKDLMLVEMLVCAY